MRNEVDFELCLLGMGWFWFCSFGLWQLVIILGFEFFEEWVEEEGR